MLYAIIAAIILIADQWLKYWVTVNITLNSGEVGLIPGVIKLINIHNNGAAFGMLGDVAFARWIFLGIAAVFIVLIIVVLAKNVLGSRFANWCCVFAMAGAVGNCLDRILYGYVVDMFKLEFVDFAIFNVADIFLVVACIAFIIYLLCDTFGKKDNTADESEDYIEEPDPGDEVFTAGIDTDTPDFPEKSAPIADEDSEQEQEAPDENSEEFWANFKSQVHREPAPKAKSAPAPKAKATSKPAPAPKAKAEDEFDLESILAEFKDI